MKRNTAANPLQLHQSAIILRDVVARGVLLIYNSEFRMKGVQCDRGYEFRLNPLHNRTLNGWLNDRSDRTNGRICGKVHEADGFYRVSESQDDRPVHKFYRSRVKGGDISNAS
jgi:hypothetical protein